VKSNIHAAATSNPSYITTYYLSMHYEKLPLASNYANLAWEYSDMPFWQTCVEDGETELTIHRKRNCQDELGSLDHSLTQSI
jgi:hypothetical protein